MGIRALATRLCETLLVFSKVELQTEGWRQLEGEGGVIVVGQIERIFGIILLIGLFFVGAFFILRGGAGALKSANAASSEQTIVVSAGSDIELDRTAVCECFNDAYKTAGWAAAGSPDYLGGLKRCRRTFAKAGYSDIGANAWTAGWKARKDGGRMGGCRQFLNSVQG